MRKEDRREGREEERTLMVILIIKTITSARTNKPKEESIRLDWSRRIHLRSGETGSKQERNNKNRGVEGCL